MRKFLLALALVAASFVGGVTVPAQAASAAPAVGPVAASVEVTLAKEKVKARACVAETKTAAARYGFDFRATMHYRDCAGSSIFDKYVLDILRPSGVNCGDGPGTITEWQINPNVIGWYNPGRKDFACINDNRLNITWNPSSGVVISDSAPYNERCLGATVKVVKNNWTDDSFSIPSRCVS